MTHPIRSDGSRIQAEYEVITQTGRDEPVPFVSHIHSHSTPIDEISAHYHEYIEIVYGLFGTFLVSVNGQEHSISEGDVLFVNSKEPHAFRRIPNSGYICLQFSPDLLFSTSRTSFEARYIMPFIMSSTSPQRHFSADELAGSDMGKLVNDVNREYIDAGYGYELAVRSDICRIFLWFIRKWKSQGVNIGISSSVRSEDLNRLESVLNFIDKNYMHPISADKMAMMCNMSYSYFSRFFKTTIGKTFSEYLTFVRVTEAEKLLVSTGYNVSQIAMETGFSNASYFITQFKKQRHMTPKKFKQKLLIENSTSEE